jgi:hypothetical protein
VFDQVVAAMGVAMAAWQMRTVGSQTQLIARLPMSADMRLKKGKKHTDKTGSRTHLERTTTQNPRFHCVPFEVINRAMRLTLNLPLLLPFRASHSVGKSQCRSSLGHRTASRGAHYRAPHKTPTRSESNQVRPTEETVDYMFLRRKGPHG